MLNKVKKYLGGFFGLLLIAILVVAFIAWGIADVFTGFSRGTIASVGKQDISTSEFRYRFIQNLNLLSRELNEPLTAEQGRAFGLDRQILNNMIAKATLDEASNNIGLAVSNEVIAERIKNDPDFAGPSGQFDKPTFRRLLQSNGLTEKMFVRDRRLFETRSQLLDALDNLLRVPESLNKIIYNHLLETRTADYILLQPDNIDAVGEPSDEDLQRFYEQAPNIFTQPERRSATILMLTADKVATTIEISDDALQNEYIAMLNDYIRAEARDINQIILETEEEVDKAKAMLAEGQGFADIAKSLNRTEDDTALGTYTHDDFLYDNLADIAFELTEGETSELIDSPIGKIIIQVQKIHKVKKPTFDEARDEIQQRLALERASEEILNFTDEIEDELADDRSLEDIAEDYNIELLQFFEIAANGVDKQGKQDARLGQFGDLVTTIFEVGLEQDLLAFETPAGGYYWVRLDAVEREHITPFEEARAQAKIQWQAREQRALLEGLAEHITERGNNEESFATLANELGKSPLRTPASNRATHNEIFSREAIEKLFITPKGGFAWGPVGFGESLVIMQVAEISLPDLSDPSLLTQMSEAEQEKLDAIIINQLIIGLQDNYGVKIDAQALRDNTTSAP